MITARSTLFVLSLAVLFGACSGPTRSQPSAGTDGPSEPTAAEQADEAARAAVGEFETFDPSQYSVQPASRAVEVSHDVPTRLLRGRADQGMKQTLEGFRVQVFSAQDQEAAQNFRERVRQWWEQAKSGAPSVFRSSPPIVVEYSQPYYRVRIGAFADRDDAEDALAFVQDEYSGAFVARSTVTIIR